MNIDKRIRAVVGAIPGYVSLIVVFVFATAVWADIEEESVVAAESVTDSILAEIVPYLCEDERFLEKASLTAESCLESTKKVLKKCSKIVAPLAPEVILGSEGNFDKEAIRSYGIVLGMCIQSSVLLSEPAGSQTTNK